MKINETKEKLPVDFITQFISNGWEEVGNLKANIDGIQNTFSGTTKVKEIMQDLMDAYLIAIGQMEAQLGNKIDIPEPKELKEALFDLPEEEPIEFADEPVEPIETEMPTEKVEAEAKVELPDFNLEIEQENDKIEIELEPKNNTPVEMPEEMPIEFADEPVEPFEFFTDFDEPEEDLETAERIRAWQNFRNN